MLSAGTLAKQQNLQIKLVKNWTSGWQSLLVLRQWPGDGQMSGSSRKGVPKVLRIILQRGSLANTAILDVLWNLQFSPMEGQCPERNKKVLLVKPLAVCILKEPVSQWTQHRTKSGCGVVKWGQIFVLLLHVSMGSSNYSNRCLHSSTATWVLSAVIAPQPQRRSHEDWKQMRTTNSHRQPFPSSRMMFGLLLLSDSGLWVDPC